MTLVEVTPRLEGIKGYDRWFINKPITITVGGMGSIGSHLAVQLSKTIPKLTIVAYDFDSFTVRNAGGQCFLMRDVNKLKTVAVSNLLLELNGEETFIIDNGKFEEGKRVTDITFSGFDNIEARELMFKEWLTLGKGIFIDGRIYKENVQVYFINADNALAIESYKEVLERSKDGDIPDTSCTMRNTFFIGSIISSFMLIGLLNTFENKQSEFESAKVPFKVAFEAETFNFTTEYV